MIILKNISKSYSNGNKVLEAVKNVSLNIEKGCITGIIGYSGAGKSSLLRCINLLEIPNNGKVLIEGRDITDFQGEQLRDVRKSIGMIFQHFNLMRSRNVFKNIAFPLKGSGLSKQEIEQRVKELLDLVGLQSKGKNYPSQLSGGEKQRVAIARALANNPKIILCDEATSALDPETTTSILHLLKEINEKLGVTIVLITHQMEVVKEICKKVVVMENGEIKESGDVVEIFSNPKAAITKKFVSAIFNENKMEGYLKTLPIAEDELLVKFAYVGKNTEEAHISELSRKFGINASILFGNIELIQNVPIGNLIVKLQGEKNQIYGALGYLNNNHIYTEVLNYAGDTN